MRFGFLLRDILNKDESLRALQKSADAFPNSHLKSAVRSISALLQTAKSKEAAQAWLQRSLKVLETLAEAVGHDPFNIPPAMLGDIRSFEKVLLEIRAAMEPPMEQGRTSRLFRLNRHRNGFNGFDKRLSELQQKFEEACSQRSSLDTPFASESIRALTVPPNPYSHTLESKPFRRRFPFSGWKSRLDPVSSTCADVASTTLKVMEKAAGSVPILSGAVSGISAPGDTAKRVNLSKERAQAFQLSEVRTAMVPITERSWISRLFRLNRNEDILDTFNHRLKEAQQRFMVGIVTQTRVEASQFQKHTADSLNTLNHRLLLSIVLF
ncbi:hypothetical protein V8E52_011636 [Russula decolorans]